MIQGGQPMDNRFKAEKKPVLASPAIIRDSIDPFISHADCKIYDSKSNYQKSLKTLGFEIVGNEKQPEPKFYIDEKKLEAAFLLACAEHGLIDISQLPQKDIMEYFID